MNEFAFNLQLFAEEDVIDGGYQGDDEEVVEETEEDVENEETSEDVEGEESEEESEESEETEELDKKTKAIIRYKKEAKEAKEKLEKLEQQKEQEKLESQKEKIVSKNIEKGYSEEEAKKMADLEIENKRLKKLANDSKFSKLENKYPLITNHRKDIVEMKKKYNDMTFEEIYLAKFYNGSSKDNEELAKQRQLYKQQEASSKKQDKGSDKSMQKGVNLSPSDERAYKILKENRPEMTRKHFAKMMNLEELEE